jgi:hypothetical protein
VIVASNPPTTPEGLWVVKYWGPWLDQTHPNPAEPGALRWFTTVAGEDREVDGPGPHMIDAAKPGELRWFTTVGGADQQRCSEDQTSH